jgi:predicted MFS family arabinose efflux permease
MSTTMRSVNRAVIVVGAPLGGLLAHSFGYRPVMWVAVAGSPWSPLPWQPLPSGVLDTVMRLNTR